MGDKQPPYSAASTTVARLNSHRPKFHERRITFRINAGDCDKGHRPKPKRFEFLNFAVSPKQK